MAASVAVAASPFRWEKRVIVIRTDTASNAKFEEQRALLLVDRDALRERDLVVFAVLGNGAIEPVFGRAPTQSSAEPIARMLTRSGDFQVAFSGKDGGVNTTATDPIKLDDLMQLIDAMPMRRQEQRK
jgi:hypothetical protein